MTGGSGSGMCGGTSLWPWPGQGQQPEARALGSLVEAGSGKAVASPELREQAPGALCPLLGPARPVWGSAWEGAAALPCLKAGRLVWSEELPELSSLLWEEEDVREPVSPSSLQDKVKGTDVGVPASRRQPWSDGVQGRRARQPKLHNRGVKVQPCGPLQPPSFLAGDGDPNWGAPWAHEPTHQIRKSTFQTFREEVYFPGQPVYLGRPVALQEHACCECQVTFRGHWPVPRAEAALPYWVPLSLRPQKQSHKTVRFCIPKAIKTCTCPCHHFGGRLPLPRNRAVMPYWVPRGLRSQRKVIRKQRNHRKALQDTPLDLRSRHNRWRICCSGRPLIKWQQLQAVHQDELLALGRAASAPAPFLTLLQAFLRVIMAIRHYFWI
ncbi:uncharacterized protein C16orf95 homolog [Sciurus carolinensis]|uniref:uncharacterized protein C16orf95 homolog n=1 Tax=Sciurus carolinensis TaxID=30640 RepID=UPI001FB1C063|nr:uncharacterized protein C16orf95 homolog [Sciurus carolinensis]